MAKWEYTETELWRFGENGDSIFHVFGTIAMGSTVLVFSEARQGDGSDAGCPHDLRMRRSEDGGRTFGEDETLVASDGTHCWTNPCPLYDKETGRLFLFYSDNLGNAATENFLMFSDDKGITWSVSKVITPLVVGENCPGDFHLAGPGHGIQLHGGPASSRLLMQFWHRRDVKFPLLERGYCVSVLYSDDHGESWKTTKCMWQTEDGLNESRLVQTQTDILWLMRTKNSTFSESRSTDGGLTWSEAAVSPLPEARKCDRGAISLQGKSGYEDMVLVSQVSSLQKRENMKIQISLDGGRSYPESFALMQGDAMPGYSDLCVIEEAEPVIGLLHCRNNHVLFSRISLQTLTGGKYENTSRNCWLQ